MKAECWNDYACIFRRLKNGDAFLSGYFLVVNRQPNHIHSSLFLLTQIIQISHVKIRRYHVIFVPETCRKRICCTRLISLGVMFGAKCRPLKKHPISICHYWHIGAHYQLDDILSIIKNREAEADRKNIFRPRNTRNTRNK